jgi:hypothetical protein
MKRLLMLLSLVVLLTIPTVLPAAAETCPSSDCSTVVLRLPVCGATLEGTVDLEATVTNDSLAERGEITHVEWWLYHPTFLDQWDLNNESRILLDASDEPAAGTRRNGTWRGSWEVVSEMTTRDTAWTIGGERPYVLPPDDGRYVIEAHVLDEQWWEDDPEPGPPPGRSRPAAVTIDFAGDNPNPPYIAPPREPGPSDFTDIDGNVHRDAIVDMASSGVIQGFDDGTFRPTAPVTRGQMAALIARALDLTGDPCVEGCGDLTCPANHTHADAIRAVTEAGIATGFEDGSFRPEELVTRGQMASFLARAFDLPPGGTDHPFEDVSGTTHESAIAAIVQAGITQGRTPTTYAPGDDVQRGQIASFLDRALG